MTCGHLWTGPVIIVQDLWRLNRHFSLENWKASLVTPDINQIQFNSLVEKSEIKHKPLPRSVFPDGISYFARGIQRNVVIVHNNYIIGHDNKVQRFKSVRLWWNNEGP